MKAMTALVGRLSLNVAWNHGPKCGLKTVTFNPYFPIVQANSADPDQMHEVSDLGLHCLPMSQN